MKEEKKKKQEEIKKEKLESNYNCISSMNFNFGAQVINSIRRYNRVQTKRVAKPAKLESWFH